MNNQKIKNKDLDVELMENALRKMIKKRYKPSLYSKFSNFSENLLLFFILCLVIIFRPINLVIGGIICIILLLIIWGEQNE